MKRSLIHLKNISKAFSNGRSQPLVALKDISLEVYSGELVAILGPSGCGKTTLLKLVAGFDHTTSGQILVDDQFVQGPSHNRTMIFQEHNLFPWKTVKQNIGFGLKATKVDREKRATMVQHYIDLVQLTGFENQFPSELSGGMRQRVAIARALVVKPDCILMDEPFGSLDAQLRSKLQNELLRIHYLENITILFVTHDIEEAIYLSDRVAVFSKRPAQIKQIYPIPLPRPRKPNLKLSKQFQELKASLLAELSD